jgi:hypothetical protein
MRACHRRLAAGPVLLIVALVVTSTGYARATAPRIERVDESSSFTLNFCPFPIRATSRFTGTQTLYFDKRGNVERTLLHLYTFATWTNPRSGQSLIERDHLFAIVYPDLSSWDIGLNYHLSLPRGRVILVDAGKLVGDADQNIVFEAGRHPIEDGDVAAMCAAIR